MRKQNILGLASLLLVLSASSGSVFAQEETFSEQIVGTWMVVDCEVIRTDGTLGPLVYGNNPLGQLIFTEEGRFAFQVAAEIPPFQSGGAIRRTTPEENESVVRGSMAYFGSYTTSDSDRTISLHIERSSIPNLNDTNGIRVVTTISADQMSWTNPTPAGGGSISCRNERAR